jgi:hypothetical protein
MTDAVIQALVTDMGNAGAVHVAGLKGPEAMACLLTAWAEMSAKVITELNPMEKWRSLEADVVKSFTDLIRGRIEARRKFYN